MVSLAGRRRCLPGGESGFTLTEVLVAMTMMLTVLFALYAIFDTSVRIFRYGSDELEAAANARVGLQRMEREIRASYPHDGGILLDAGVPMRSLSRTTQRVVRRGRSLTT